MGYLGENTPKLGFGLMRLPKLKNGDIIVYTTHANVLLSYGLKSEETVFETE